MDIKLQPNVAQRLTFTLQLQQSIRLLQLSSFELQQETEKMLESNFMLETNNIEEPFEVKNIETETFAEPIPIDEGLPYEKIPHQQTRPPQ